MITTWAFAHHDLKSRVDLIFVPTRHFQSQREAFANRSLDQVPSHFWFIIGLSRGSSQEKSDGGFG